MSDCSLRTTLALDPSSEKLLFWNRVLLKADEDSVVVEGDDLVEFGDNELGFGDVFDEGVDVLVLLRIGMSHLEFDIITRQT